MIRLTVTTDFTFVKFTTCWWKSFSFSIGISFNILIREPRAYETANAEWHVWVKRILDLLCHFTENSRTRLWNDLTCRVSFCPRQEWELNAVLNWRIDVVGKSLIKRRFTPCGAGTALVPDRLKNQMRPRPTAEGWTSFTAVSTLWKIVGSLCRTSNTFLSTELSPSSWSILQFVVGYRLLLCNHIVLDTLLSWRTTPHPINFPNTMKSGWRFTSSDNNTVGVHWHRNPVRISSATMAIPARKQNARRFVQNLLLSCRPFPLKRISTATQPTGVPLMENPRHRSLNAFKHISSVLLANLVPICSGVRYGKATILSNSTRDLW